MIWVGLLPLLKKETTSTVVSEPFRTGADALGMSQGGQLSNPALSLVRSDSWSEGLASRDYHALINQDINY